MNKDTALVFYYLVGNRYGFNALAGALETDSYFDDLQIYFPDKDKKLFQTLEEAVKKHQRIIIGISFFTTQLWNIAELVKKIREKYGMGITLIAGGPHPTGDPLGTLKMGFDIIVRSEGEETLIELLKKIDNDEDHTAVTGISFLNIEGKHIYTGRRPWVDLNSYPPFSLKYKKYGHIEITRGCPFACYFCQNSHISGGIPRHRSIENITRYFDIMSEKGFTDFRAITPNAFSYGSPDGKTIDFNKVEELLKSIKAILRPSGGIYLGSFPSEVRPEHVTPETLELILSYADNDNLVIGAQSGSQRMLDICHRGHTVDDIYQAVKLTTDAGLKANVDFIFGLPHETEEDIRLTIKVMQDMVKLNARIHAHTFMPLPQTPFAKMPAGEISDEIEKMINDLLPAGVFYGNWREQAQQAKKIAAYLNNGQV